MGTKNNPAKFDCYAAAEPDEPMFVLLGRDPTAAMVVTFWRALRMEMGGTSDAKLDEARSCSLALEQWAKAKGKDLEAATAAFHRVLDKAGKTKGHEH